MLKRLSLIILISALIITTVIIKQNSSSLNKSNKASSEKWDKDRSARLSGNDLDNDAETYPDGDEAIKRNPVDKSGKIDFKKLSSIDYKTYSWGLNLNKEHEPTTIPVYAKNLLIKYNGIFQGDTSRKEVYLTFDEGYEYGFTPGILDTLKANQVKALFFVTGPYLKSSGDLVKRMLREGHQVGNHTINHLSLPGLSNDKLEHELFGLEKSYNELTGFTFKYMRPPSGEYSERVLFAAKELGYKTVFWSYAYVDFDTNNQKGPEHAYNMVMNNLHNGAVILLHAVSRDNSEALDRIIKGIKEEGYEIKPFDL